MARVARDRTLGLVEAFKSPQRQVANGVLPKVARNKSEAEAARGVWPDDHSRPRRKHSLPKGGLPATMLVAQLRRIHVVGIIQRVQVGTQADRRHLDFPRAAMRRNGVIGPEFCEKN